MEFSRHFRVSPHLGDTGRQGKGRLRACARGEGIASTGAPKVSWAAWNAEGRQYLRVFPGQVGRAEYLWCCRWSYCSCFCLGRAMPEPSVSHQEACSYIRTFPIPTSVLKGIPTMPQMSRTYICELVSMQLGPRVAHTIADLAVHSTDKLFDKGFRLTCCQLNQLTGY